MKAPQNLFNKWPHYIQIFLIIIIILAQVYMSWNLLIRPEKS